MPSWKLSTKTQPKPSCLTVHPNPHVTCCLPKPHPHPHNLLSTKTLVWLAVHQSPTQTLRTSCPPKHHPSPHDLLSTKTLMWLAVHQNPHVTCCPPKPHPNLNDLLSTKTCHYSLPTAVLVIVCHPPKPIHAPRADYPPKFIIITHCPPQPRILTANTVQLVILFGVSSWTYSPFFPCLLNCWSSWLFTVCMRLCFRLSCVLKAYRSIIICV